MDEIGNYQQGVVGSFFLGGRGGKIYFSLKFYDTEKSYIFAN